MGSGGSYIGYLVAKELGFKYVDHDILRQAAEYLGTDTGALEHLDEKSPGFFEAMLRGFSYGALEAAYVPPLMQPIYGRDLFASECKIMNDILDQHSAVIVGRAGFYALKNRSRVIRVFIHAPQGFRIKRVMKVQNLTDEREAQTMVEKSDRKRTRFIKDMAGVDWTDARNYHLSIDSSIIDFPTCVEMIVKLQQMFN